MLVLWRRFPVSTSLANHCIVSLFNRYCSNSWPSIDKNAGTSDPPISFGNQNINFRNHLGGISHFPLFWQDQPQLDRHEIKVVDLDTWAVFSNLAHASKDKPKKSELQLFDVEKAGVAFYNLKVIEDGPDFDDIEDMRTHGNLFYKIERSSKEFEEYRFNFRGRKTKSNKNDEKECQRAENPKSYFSPNCQQSSTGEKGHQLMSNKRDLKDHSLVNRERLARLIKEKYVTCTPDDIDGSCVRRKRRTPTFNQLTGPYHQPFCLDIFISKSSVRACVVHRVASKVVIVAHSISKDMKFDLGSTKSVATAAVVGKILAQRALADDIHDVVYMPRKGDKLEGKLQIVLQSIIDNGVNVKLRLKQTSKAIGRSMPDEEGS